MWHLIDGSSLPAGQTRPSRKNYGELLMAMMTSLAGQSGLGNLELSGDWFSGAGVLVKDVEIRFLSINGTLWKLSYSKC